MAIFIDTHIQETYPGLIRVKKVFPMGPAYESGELRPYDIILEANGVALSGLTNHVSKNKLARSSLIFFILRV